MSFPYEFNPLVLRSIAHIPRDGKIRKDGFSRWIQKDTAYMQELLRKLLGTSTKPSKKQLCIARFLIKVSCSALGIQPEELNSSKFVKALMSLPRPHKVQGLLALIEDEATIDINGAIDIRMTSKELTNAYARLCDSLDYKRNKVTREPGSGFSRGNTMDKFKILTDGIRSLYKDYIMIVKTFGRIGGLWRKDQILRKKCEKALSDKALKYSEGRKLTKKILTLFSEKEDLSAEEICNLLKLETKGHCARIYNKIRYLLKKGKVKRVGYGRYALVKNS